MEIRTRYNNSYKPNFEARFLHSEALHKIAEYAVSKGKFPQLNTSRLNVEKQDLTTRLIVDTFYKNDCPVLLIKRLKPKRSVRIAYTNDDYEVVKEIKIASSKKDESCEAFALKMLIKMGNNAPRNNLYKRIIRRS